SGNSPQNLNCDDPSKDYYPQPNDFVTDGPYISSPYAFGTYTTTIQYTPNAACTGFNTPFQCCSASGSGSCLGTQSSPCLCNDGHNGSCSTHGGTYQPGCVDQLETSSRTVTFNVYYPQNYNIGLGKPIALFSHQLFTDKSAADYNGADGSGGYAHR